MRRPWRCVLEATRSSWLARHIERAGNAFEALSETRLQKRSTWLSQDGCSRGLSFGRLLSRRVLAL